jgi:hypothetical protein
VVDRQFVTPELTSMDSGYGGAAFAAPINGEAD